MCSNFQELAHDLSQPLTIIETTAYCLELMLPKDNPAIAAHLRRIRHQVVLASRMLSAARAQESSTTLARRKAARAGASALLGFPSPR
jgi:signal transduction histidine kinase